MNVTLVDPSLYTGPYDAALTDGLRSAGVRPMWITRPVRAGDRPELPPDCAEPLFYRRTDQTNLRPGARRLLKGCAHFAGAARMLWRLSRQQPDLVHVQWIVVPLIDIAAMAMIRRSCPLVLTVHDTVAYNGQTMSLLQRLGHRLPTQLAHRVIVHTVSGRRALLRQGVPDERISVIPHGPLRLRVPPAPSTARDARWTMVLFGEIKPYKGLDVLIDAVAALEPTVRRQLRVVVAGRPRMDVAPLLARITELGLAEHFELRLKRLTEEEMAALFAEADGFVFPYRQIDASGVYYLVKPLAKWLVASRVGVFAEEMESGAYGALVPPEDVPALAQALRHCIEARPRAGLVPAADTSWAEIGRMTRQLYERVKVEFETRHLRRAQRAVQR